MARCEVRTFRLIAMAAGLSLASAAFPQAAPVASSKDEAPMHEGTEAAAPGSASSPSAVPAAPARAAPKTFADFDANRDGRLGRDEVAGDTTWTAEFDAADADGNGYLSKAEFGKHAAKLQTRKPGRHQS